MNRSSSSNRLCVCRELSSIFQADLRVFTLLLESPLGKVMKDIKQMEHCDDLSRDIG